MTRKPSKRIAPTATQDSISWLVDVLLQRSECLSIASLVPLFHAAHCVLSDPTKPRNKSEARNLRVLHELLPDHRLGIAGTLYKPSPFIHPFGDHYSLPGYLDSLVLPYYRATVDGLTKNLPRSTGRDFLAFVYTFFLLVHPLVDGNGRVARSLLDYYNAKLSLGLDATVWQSPQFKERAFHIRAFQAFFVNEAKLRPRQQDDPYPMTHDLKVQVGRMADYMIDWATKIAIGDQPIGARSQVANMAAGLRKASAIGSLRGAKVSRRS
jgi:hypothetical protein